MCFSLTLILQLMGMYKTIRASRMVSNFGQTCDTETETPSVKSQVSSRAASIV